MNKIKAAELIARYNAAAATLGRKPVKKFVNRATAEKRLAAIEGEVAKKKGAAEKPTALSRGEFDPDSIGEKRGLRFDHAGSKTKVAPREGSMRAKLLGVLQEAGAKGIDFEELHRACGFLNRKSTRDAIALLSRKNGYAITGTDAAVRLAK
jgi:hypothetical protein